VCEVERWLSLARLLRGGAQFIFAQHATICHAVMVGAKNGEVIRRVSATLRQWVNVMNINEHVKTAKNALRVVVQGCYAFGAGAALPMPEVGIILATHPRRTVNTGAFSTATTAAWVARPAFESFTAYNTDLFNGWLANLFHPVVSRQPLAVFRTVVIANADLRTHPFKLFAAPIALKGDAGIYSVFAIWARFAFVVALQRTKLGAGVAGESELFTAILTGVFNGCRKMFVHSKPPVWVPRPRLLEAARGHLLALIIEGKHDDNVNITDAVVQ
jgi:hypothetical protein